MNINRHNYEAFFLDHLEGRLTPEQEIELMEFLSLNPNLAAELTEFESVYLTKEEIIFEGKPGIKKNEGELTPVEQLIALMEGDLAQKEATELKKKVQTDKYLQTQMELLSKTKLIPDASIRFPNKNKLKHRGKVVYMWRYAAAAAAVVIIGFIIFRNIPVKNRNEIATQKSVPVQPAVIPSAHNNKVDVREEKKVLADNKKSTRELQSQKKSIQKENVSEQPEQILISPEVAPAENAQLAVKSVPVVETVAPVASGTFNYSEVFTEAEWKELHNMSIASESTPLQKLAKEGIGRLGKLTGVHVQFPNKEKQQDVFAFSVGNFEVRHVSAK